MCGSLHKAREKRERGGEIQEKHGKESEIEQDRDKQGLRNVMAAMVSWINY